GVTRRDVDAGTRGDGRMQPSLPLHHPGPDIGPERAHRGSQFSDGVTDVLSRACRCHPPGLCAGLATCRNPRSNAQTEPEYPLHRVFPSRRRPRGRRPDALSLRLRLRIALLRPYDSAATRTNGAPSVAVNREVSADTLP